MNIDTVPLEDHQVKITVEVDQDTFESAKRRAARKLSKRAKIPGFRPGKAPYPVIVRHIGEAAILEDAVELTVEDLYPNVIDEAGIEPYGPGSLDSIPEMDPPTFVFIVPLRATVELGDYHSIRVAYEPKEITDDDVEDVINNLREQQAVIEPVERPAQEGDMLTIQLSAHRTKTDKDENATLIEDRSIPLLIEADDVDESAEWPYPGFSRELIGTSMGDERSSTFVYPDDSPFESFRGIEAEFNVLVEDIKSRTLPDVDDELAQSIGDYESLDKLRTTVRENLDAQARDTYNEEYDNKVLDDIIEISPVKYPPQMLNNEIDNVVENMESRLASQGLDLDLYLKTRDIDLDALREEAKPVAESRIKKSLILLELANAEDIKVDPNELQEETTRTLDEASRVLSEKELRKLTTKDSTTNIVSNIMMDLLIQRTQELISDIARGLESKDDAEEAETEALAADLESSTGTVTAEDMEEPYTEEKKPVETVIANDPEPSQAEETVQVDEDSL